MRIHLRPQMRGRHRHIPYMMIAPTMTGPEVVQTNHSGNALWAVLRQMSAHKQHFDDVYCPGLGTGIGGIPPDEAARDMALAYRRWLEFSSPKRG